MSGVGHCWVQGWHCLAGWGAINECSGGDWWDVEMVVPWVAVVGPWGGGGCPSRGGGLHRQSSQDRGWVGRV